MLQLRDIIISDKSYLKIHKVYGSTFISNENYYESADYLLTYEGL
jgi:hypothetical protein